MDFGAYNTISYNSNAYNDGTGMPAFASQSAAWNLRRGISASLSPSWALRQNVGAFLSPAWGVRQVAAADQGAAWNLHQNVVEPGDAAWDLRQVAAQDQSARWHVTNPARKCQKVFWSRAGAPVQVNAGLTASGLKASLQPAGAYAVLKQQGVGNANSCS